MLRTITRREIVLACVSAGLLVLSFPSTAWAACAWFGLVPLFLAIDGKRPGRAFVIAYLAGVIFWAGLVYWLANVTFLGQCILICYLALYFGAFGYLAGKFNLLQNKHLFYTVPALWVLLEFLRSHALTGFGWALIGYSQCPLLPSIQIAEVTGVWGVSFLVVMLNAVVFALIGYRYIVFGVARRMMIIVVCFLLVFVYGIVRIAQVKKEFTRQAMSVAVVQPNIAQKLKWDPSARPYILREYARLSALASGTKTDLMVWPEAASPVILGEDDAVFYRIASLSADVDVPFLLGVVRSDGEHYFNSATLIDRARGVTQMYNKLHLVPFGEYIPLKKVFPFLEVIVPIGDISAGDEWTRLIHKGVPFSVLICFEDLFPELSRGFILRGAQFLVNITNDAWYEETSAARQHFQASVFRAVENRVYLVRSANTGVSGIIRPDGSAEIVRDANGKAIFVNGYVTGDVMVPQRPFQTIYTRCGDWFVVAVFVMLLGFLIFNRRRTI